MYLPIYGIPLLGTSGNGVEAIAQCVVDLSTPQPLNPSIREWDLGPPPNSEEAVRLVAGMHAMGLVIFF
jgi:hypothetical protein